MSYIKNENSNCFHNPDMENISDNWLDTELCIENTTCLLCNTPLKREYIQTYRHSYHRNWKVA
jgi:hypothetical protein